MIIGKVEENDKKAIDGIRKLREEFWQNVNVPGEAGNYNLGVTDQSIFAELSFEETQHIHGLQITMVIKGGNKVNSRALLEKFGFPFEKEGGVR